MNKNPTLSATRTVSLGTAASRAFGLLRSILMASLFGTSLAQSVFVIAFRIPNLFRRLFGEGAMSAAFIPVFADTLEKDGLDQANRLAGRVATLLSVTLAMIVAGGLLVILSLRHWAPVSDRAALFLTLLGIMLPYLFFICLVALCMAMLNSFHHFFVPAFTPLLLNAVWIATLLWIAPRFGDRPEERIHGVAWGILAAGALQLLVQFPVLAKFGIRPPLLFSLHDKRLQRVLRAMGPAAIGMGVFQINVLVDSLLAWWVADWAPAALGFAEMIVYLPLGIFGTALGTVLLPVFSRQAARNAEDGIRSTLAQSLAGLMALMIPAAFGLMVLAQPVVQLIYEWPGREFDALSTLQTARALVFYAPGLIVFGAYKTLVPAFYALKDTRTPVRVGMGVVGLNFLLNVLFILTWPVGFKHAGLACATVLASAINCAVLIWLLQRKIGVLVWRPVAKTMIGSLLAAGLMAVAVFAFHAWIRPYAARATGLPLKAQEALCVGAAIALGALIYGAIHFVLRLKNQA